MTFTKALTMILLFVSCAVAQEAKTHKFLDRTNVALFVMHAGTTAWDAAETHNGVNAKYCTATYFYNTPTSSTTYCTHYQHYIAEGNPLGRPFVRTTPGQIAFFGGTVVANVAAAYWLHRSGHHKLERVVSAVNIGFSIRGASSWTYNRRTVLPPAPCAQVGTCQ